jgi:hypothetical protein
MSLNIENVTKVWKDGRREPVGSLTTEELAHVKANLALQCASALRARFPTVHWEAFPADDDPDDIIVQASCEFEASEIMPVVQQVIQGCDFTGHSIPTDKPWENN